MDTELARAQHYRDLAANMRSLADQEADEVTRKSLVTMAANYEHLYQACIDRAGKAHGVTGPVGPV